MHILLGVGSNPFDVIQLNSYIDCYTIIMLFYSLSTFSFCLLIVSFRSQALYSIMEHFLLLSTPECENGIIIQPACLAIIIIMLPFPMLKHVYLL